MSGKSYKFAVDPDAEDINEEAHGKMRNVVDNHFGRGAYDRVMSGKGRNENPKKKNLQDRNRELANLITNELEGYMEELRSILESVERDQKFRNNEYLRVSSKYEEAIKNLNERRQGKSSKAEIKEKYRRGNRKEVEQVLQTVLKQSEYPNDDAFNGDPHLTYRSDRQQLIIDYPIPAPEDIPKRKEVKYIKSRDVFKPMELSDRQFQELYESILYQIALRSVYEVFVGDEAEVIRSVVFNGRFTSVNPATGHEETNCILTLQTSREEILGVNFSQADPEACFEYLGGMCASIIDEESTVIPIAQTDGNSGEVAEEQDLEEELGYVYVLVSSEKPELVKIGSTKRTPKERAKELSSSTGVAMPYVVVYQAEVSRPREVERAVHKRLSQKRVNPNREFFRVEPRRAVEVIEQEA